MLSTLPLSFVTVVETGSITQAADVLSIAKSAVSQNLKRLEEELGVKLATRTTRRFSLTPAGERYYRRCKEILALSQRAATEMEDFGATPAGSITLTAPHAMIAPVIAPALSNVINQYPRLKPTIIADDKRLDLIASGIDVAITVGKLADSSLRARKVGVLNDVLCASPELLQNIKLGHSARTISQLEALPYIAHSREEGICTHRLSNKKQSLTVKFEPSLFANTVAATLALTRAGLGIALLPSLAVADDLRSGALIELFPNFSLPQKDIYAVHAYDTMPPKSVTEVINAVRKELMTEYP
ncbi:LysR family transcriptional regulator [Pleionea sp. CnH1-48]|uniref:LysR family transcriptional regulator n=1 Tax=Pleionea sp. CnH1-48 TaxID=2954494 RepID=UPI002097F799|nr:LysR family transcriptional regulator [Pleionea sp. CnH1-48]MCO7222695.1 LysR family transcriptional regulator [Pleionea sp. CnH1-48]